MAKCHINLEDVEGRVAVQVQWPGDFDKESHAHQVGLLALKYIDSLLEQLVEPEIVTSESRHGTALYDPSGHLFESSQHGHS